MDQNNLDQIFRNSLFDHKTAIDKDLLWAAISKKQHRRRTVWTLAKVVGIFLLLGTITIGLSLQNRPVQTEAPGSAHDESTSVVTNTELNITDNKSSKTTKNGRTNSKVTQAISETQNSSLFTGSVALAKESEILKTQRTAKNTASDSKPTLKTKTSKQQDLSLKTIQKTNSTSIIKASTINKVDQPQPNNFFKLIAKLPARKTAQPEAIGSSSNASVNYSRPTFLSTDKIECYDHRAKLAPFYVELYTTIDFVKNRFSAGLGEQLSYLEERKATQTQLEGYRAGLRFKYLLRSGLYLKSGIELGITRERFDRTTTEERTEIWPNQLLETITQSDTTIFIYGDKPVDIIENTTWKVWNTYRTIGIPLLIGYQRNIGNFTYGIELGGIYNIQHKFEGMLLDNQLEPNMVTEYFKSRINTSVTGGFHIGYQLNKRYQLNAYSSFKHNLSEINSSQNPVYQSNSKVGLGLGLEMKL